MLQKFLQLFYIIILIVQTKLFLNLTKIFTSAKPSFYPYIITWYSNYDQELHSYNYYCYNVSKNNYIISSLPQKIYIDDTKNACKLQLNYSTVFFSQCTCSALWEAKKLNAFEIKFYKLLIC